MADKEQGTRVIITRGIEKYIGLKGEILDKLEGDLYPYRIKLDNGVYAFFRRSEFKLSAEYSKGKCDCKVSISGTIFYCPLHKSATALYEALLSWDKLRAMRPMDSGADIEAILNECSDITDKALALAEGK